jgi:two-component system chemotaxis sensor kinase CheA
MPINLDRVQETFFEEAPEHLAEMEASLLRLEASPGDADLLNRIFRGAHSIKGASGLFGFTAVAGLTHVLENLLDRMRTGQVRVERPLIDLLLRAVDGLRGLVASARTAEPGPAGIAETEALLRAALGVAAPPEQAAPAEAPPAPGGPRVYHIDFEPQPGLFGQAMDPLLLLRNLSRRGEVLGVCADTNALPGLEDLDPGQCYLRWAVRLRSDQTAAELAGVFRFVEECSRVRIEVVEDPARAGDNAGSAQRLVRVARELFAAHAAFGQAFARLAAAALPRRPQVSG